jgi:hypothetical protein
MRGGTSGAHCPAIAETYCLSWEKSLPSNEKRIGAQNREAGHRENIRATGSEPSARSNKVYFIRLLQDKPRHLGEVMHYTINEVAEIWRISRPSVFSIMDFWQK